MIPARARNGQDGVRKGEKAERDRDLVACTWLLVGCLPNPPGRGSFTSLGYWWKLLSGFTVRPCISTGDALRHVAAKKQAGAPKPLDLLKEYVPTSSFPISAGHPSVLGMIGACAFPLPVVVGTKTSEISRKLRDPNPRHGFHQPAEPEREGLHFSPAVVAAAEYFSDIFRYRNQPKNLCSHSSLTQTSELVPITHPADLADQSGSVAKKKRVGSLIERRTGAAFHSVSRNITPPTHSEISMFFSAPNSKIKIQQAIFRALKIRSGVCLCPKSVLLSIENVMEEM